MEVLLGRGVHRLTYCVAVFPGTASWPFHRLASGLSMRLSPSVLALVLSLQTDRSWFREQNLETGGSLGSGLDQDPAQAPGSGVLGEPQLAATGTPHANIMQIQTKARTTVWPKFQLRYSQT